MERFTKVTTGFVCQSYQKDDHGEFVCTHQEFIAGDQVDYEDSMGNKITPPEHKYQPFEMTLSEKQTSCDKLQPVPVENFASDILKACCDITSYASQLLYEANDQVDLTDIKEIREATEAIEKYKDAGTVFSQLKNACDVMLETLDVGGEQSRQFANEISMLKEVLDISEIQVMDAMIDRAKKSWPNLDCFDFVRCTNCTFLGLVQLSDEKCPDCGEEALKWADRNNLEYCL